LKLGKSSEVFLDTSFILPFFQTDISVEAFNLNKFREFLTKLSKVHFSELSIFEAKAKLYRLSRKKTNYIQVLKAFGTNLATLREDEKFIFHSYTAQDDKNFNLIYSKNLELDSFDMIIIAQALNIGTLITEDKEILSAREQTPFITDPTLGKINIKQWKELTA
jgi:predicted nucleic acid-binding protein